MVKKRNLKHEFLVSLSPEDHKILTKLAKKEVTTKIDIIRRALRQYAEGKVK